MAMTDPLLSPWTYDRQTGWTDEDPATPIFNGMFTALARRWKQLDDEAGIPEDRRVEVGIVGLHHDEDGDGWADRDDERPAYVYTDPVEDPAYPGITAMVPKEHGGPPDAFPEGWSSEPTERDLAAIEAGNA